MSSASATLFGPVRRSSRPAIEVGQLVTAIARCAALSMTCSSFSASAKVASDSFGPPAARC
jgi:hypothetical protein